MGGMYGVHECLINLANSEVTFAWTPGDMEWNHRREARVVSSSNSRYRRKWHGLRQPPAYCMQFLANEQSIDTSVESRNLTSTTTHVEQVMKRYV